MKTKLALTILLSSLAASVQALPVIPVPDTGSTGWMLGLSIAGVLLAGRLLKLRK